MSFIWRPEGGREGGGGGKRGGNGNEGQLERERRGREGGAVER